MNGLVGCDSREPSSLRVTGSERGSTELLAVAADDNASQRYVN